MTEFLSDIHLTAFDYIVFAIVGMSVLLSLMRGMVKEIMSLANWTIAFWVANHYGTDLVVHMPFVDGLSEPMKVLVGMGAAFLLSMLLGAVFVWLMGRIISAAGLGFADRGLGMVFGTARGLAIVWALVVAAGLTSLPQKDWWKKAWLSGPAVEAVRWSKPHLPEKVTEWIRY